MIAAATSGLPGGDQVLFEIVVMLGAAVVVGMAMQRMRQSVLVGYLIAGMLLGPGALGVISDTDPFSQLGEIGVALLLFAIGLELPWQRVQHLARRSLLAGFVQVALTIAVAGPVLVWLGLDTTAAATVAMAIALSSTAVVMRVLADRSEVDSVHGLAALGVLLAQDLAVVVFLLVVTQFARHDAHGVAPFVSGLGLALVKLLALVGAMYLVEIVVMRRLFRNAALGPERDLLAVASITISLGAVGACYELGLSPALGGFVAGMIMADAAYADQVRAEIAPIRMGLMAVFFAWVGMLADLSWIARHPLEIVAGVVSVIVLKVVLSALSLHVFGAPRFVAVLAGVALAQLGEFSFAIIALAGSTGVIGHDVFQLFVSVSLVTLLLTPTLIGLASRFVHRERTLGGDAHGGEHAGPQLRNHGIVIGFGPAGQRVVEALVRQRIPVAIVELNPRLRTPAPPEATVLYGDAAQPEILERAQVEHAALVVVTIPEPASLRRMVRQIAAIAPDVPIVARGRYHIYVEQVRDAGAREVIDEESVAGDRLARSALALLGADT